MDGTKLSIADKKSQRIIRKLARKAASTLVHQGGVAYRAIRDAADDAQRTSDVGSADHTALYELSKWAQGRALGEDGYKRERVEMRAEGCQPRRKRTAYEHELATASMRSRL